MASLEDIKKLMDQSTNKLLCSIKLEMSDIKNELANKIDEISTKMNSDISELKHVISTLTKRVEFLEDKANRNDRECQLKIHNVPITINEKPITYYFKIADAIGFSSTNTPPEVFILPNSAKVTEISNKIVTRNRQINKSQDVNGIIIVKFSSATIKKEFHKCYFKTKNLNQSIFGLKTTDRIYINDNLTKHNHQIFQEASRLKKTAVISKLKTINGQIYISKLLDGKLIRITDINQLSKLA